jgi:flagellar M-ring protein FliF
VLVRWNVLDARGRGFAIAGLAIVLALLAFGGIAQRDTRVALFATPLRSEQVVEVVERLAEWNAPFVTGTDNVRVDAALRNALLMRLSFAGVPHAHLASSVEALAKAGPLTPQSVLDAQQRDGLAGDIAAGLRDIADIADARVIIAPAREGAFVDEARHEATASVRLSLKPGAAPSREAIDGVRQYVAAAVPGLDPKRVAILDDRGLALGDDARSPVGEAHVLESSLQSALDLALGAAATIVRVHVNYDPRVRALHDIVRKPIGSRAIGTTTVDEHYKSATKQYAKSNSSLDRGSEVHDETIETPAGRLERISVAVAVDQSRHLDLAKIRSLASGMLGLVSARGDSLSVEEIAFARPLPVSTTPFAPILGLVAALAPMLVLAVVAIVCVRAYAAPVARICETFVERAAVGRTREAMTGFAPSHVRGALRNEPPHTAAAIMRRMSRASAPVVPDYETVLRRG